jgi:hypothetical protein
MSDVTSILSEIERGDSSVAERLLPVVYDELRRLAAARLANERPGQTLQATALVHDAYVRLVDNDLAPFPTSSCMICKNALKVEKAWTCLAGCVALVSEGRITQSCHFTANINPKRKRGAR